MRWRAARCLRALLVALGCLGTALAQAGSPPPTAPPSAATAVDEARARARELAAQGNYAQAIPHAREALGLGQKAYGPRDLKTASLINELARLHELQGEYAKAEPLYKKALAMANRALGGDGHAVANGIANLANLYRLRGRYKEAEPLFRRALKMAVKTLGGRHMDVARIANDAALLYLALGRYDVAEKLYMRVLGIIAEQRGPRHLDTAMALNNAANFYYRRGGYAKAEALHRQSLDIKEEALGPDHPSVAVSLNNLAQVYLGQGAFERARGMLARALDITERRLGPDHPAVAERLNNLATLYQESGDYEAAEVLLTRALSIGEARFGIDHERTAQLLNNLSVVYIKQGRLDEAQPLQMRALDINRKAFGADNIKVAANLHNAAEIHRRQGQVAEAEPLHLAALRIRIRALGEEHPGVAHNLLRLAQTQAAAGKEEMALASIRRASAIHRLRAARPADRQRRGAFGEQAAARPAFLFHLEMLARKSVTTSEALVAEALEVAQLAKVSRVSRTVAQVAARFAAGDDALAKVVRARQDAARRLADLDGELLDALVRPPNRRDAESERQLRSEILVLRRKLGGLDDTLAERFPRYAELVSARPVTLGALQAVLAPDEAVLFYVVGEEASYLIAVRADRAELHRLAIGAFDLDDEIAELRAALDQTAVKRVDDILPFDVMAASFLYQQLIAPAEPLLAGARNVFVVPDGALQSLPFGVLVTEPRIGIVKLDVIGGGRTREIHDFFAYRSVPWLAAEYALTVVPAVGSLVALRRAARRSKAPFRFVAFADPLLDGPPGGARGIPRDGLYRRGAGVDVNELRRMPRLPDTADEVRALARTLGAGEESLFLQGDATETRVRATDLSAYRVVAFATHGLMAGDFGRLTEPALVLTPPDRPSAQDDGLLTASEIAGLELDADWVVLSACNTAAADGTPGAEGLTGLAKAFFYAGSRALLVSHWSVVSDAATKLTTTLFAEAAANPRLGRAEALHRAMRAVMTDREKPYYAHPMFWAPFVVVGEGAAAGSGEVAE